MLTDQERIEQLERENKRLVTGKRRREAQRLTLWDAAERAVLSQPKFTIPAPPKRGTSKSRETAIVHLTDIHIGKVTDSYSTGVARDRMRLAAKKVHRIAEVRRGGASIDHCVVMLGGDIVEGESIFPGQQLHLDDNLITQATKTGPDIISEFLCAMLYTFRTVHVVGVYGNHGRSGQKDDPVSAVTNFDSIVYQLVKARFHGHKRITFDVESKWRKTFYLGGWGFMLTHGHIGLTFQDHAIIKRVGLWADSLDPFNYLFFGHFHGHKNLICGTSREAFATGTVVSGDPHAEKRFSLNPPMQRVAFLHKGEGLVSNEPIYLAERKPALEAVA